MQEQENYTSKREILEQDLREANRLIKKQDQQRRKKRKAQKLARRKNR